MPFEQLRALVVLLIEPQDDDDHNNNDDDDDPVGEFDTQPTMFRPNHPPRASTLDDLIASLRAATAPSNDPADTRPRKRM